MTSLNGDSPAEQSLTELIQSYAPEGEIWPELPGFHPDSGWEVGTTCRRNCPGRTRETGLCPPIEEQIPIDEPHILVTARRDQFPDAPSQTAEFKEFVFPSRDELRLWFEDEKDA